MTLSRHQLEEAARPVRNHAGKKFIIAVALSENIRMFPDRELAKNRIGLFSYADYWSDYLNLSLSFSNTRGRVVYSMSESGRRWGSNGPCRRM
jgi:hypothetical protein